MNYLMKSGTLYLEPSNKLLAKVTKSFLGPERTITLPGEGKLLETTILNQETAADKKGDVRYRIYVLRDSHDEILMEAYPNYSPSEDPDQNGWPTYRVPKVNHARIHLKNHAIAWDPNKSELQSQDEEAFRLRMLNSQYYRLEDVSGRSIFEMMHKGITGGWAISSEIAFPPEIICALFIFCRYIEQENEFPIV